MGFSVQPIATVREASLEDYEDSMTACAEARRMWMLVMYLVSIVISFLTTVVALCFWFSDHAS